MENWINNVTYGNISQGLLKQLKIKCISDEVLKILDDKELLSIAKNDSKKTKDELNEITKCVNSMSDEENKEHLIRYNRYDRSLIQTICSIFMNKGIDVEELCLSINADIVPTITKLKAKYQRARPNQLAQYYKLKLFPYESFSAHSPSFPSGHTLQAYVILNIIGNKYPESYRFCKQLIEDVANSRVYLGLHYPSDNEGAILIGKEILKLKSMITKYNI